MCAQEQTTTLAPNSIEPVAGSGNGDGKASGINTVCVCVLMNSIHAGRLAAAASAAAN